MDQAVALVETYLRVNGYFTVTEYPLLEAAREGGYRSVTDLDVLAFRFPGAGRAVPQTGRPISAVFAPDSALGAIGEEADMIIGEVKEGKAELNEAATDPSVLRAALTRFGCCRPEHAGDVVQELLRKGEAIAHCHHRVRLVAFGSVPGERAGRKYTMVLLGHVSEFLRAYIREHWEVLRHAQFKDPIFGLLVMEEKACAKERGPSTAQTRRGK